MEAEKPKFRYFGSALAIRSTYTVTVNFRKLSFFLEKWSLIVMSVSWKKNFVCTDLSKYRLITIFLEFFAYDL